MLSSFNKLSVTNNLVVFIFTFFLISIFIGPFTINLSYILFISLFIYKIFKKNLKIDISLNSIVILQIIFCVYLIINTFFINSEFIFNGQKSLFYFRFFLFAFIVSQLLSLNNGLIKIISLIFCFVSIILSLDIFLQYITGYDIFSYKAGLCVYPTGEQNYNPRDCERFSGFFGKEFIAGSFLSTYGLFFTFLSYYLIKKNKLKNFIFFILFIFLIFGIVISGERNAILSVILIFLFNFVFNKSLRKLLSLIFIFLVIIISISFLKFEHTKYRYLDWPTNYIMSKKGNIIQKLLTTSWGSHYLISYDIISNNLIFGKGYKSFRSECAKEKYNFENLNEKYNLNLESSGCTTHPHNLYLEILAESGIFGFIIFFLILYFLIYKKYRKRSKNTFNNTIVIFSLSIIFSFLFPLRPTGSFSATVYGTNLWFFIGFYLFLVKNHKYK